MANGVKMLNSISDPVKFCIFAAGGAAVAAVSVAVIDKITKTTSHNPSMTLYHSFPTESSRCAWLIEELGKNSGVDIIKSVNNNIGSEDEHVEEGEIRAPALLIENGPTLVESGSICMFLADLHGRLQPSSLNKGEYYDWIIYTTSKLDHITKVLYRELVCTPMQHRQTDVIDYNLTRFQEFASQIDASLQDRLYICGDSFTAADCVLGYSIWLVIKINNGQLVRNYRNIIYYYHRLAGRHAFQRVFGANSSLAGPRI